MNSSREVKSAAKGQKKQQKINSKKQKQQQQQQQQQLVNGIAKSAKATKTDEAKPNTRNNNNNNNHNNNNNNNISLNNNNNYSSMVQNNNNNNNGAVSTTTTTTTMGATGATTTGSATSTNITQKFREQYDAERRASLQHAAELPKIERSNSIRGKLSRFINHLTGSKENLARHDDARDEHKAEKAPFAFTRSRSMILLRRPNRRSFIEPQLEQLSEEAEKSGDPLSPTASLQSLQAIDNMVSYANMSFIDYDKFNGYEKQLERQASLMSLAAEQQQSHLPKLPLPATASPLPSPHTPTPTATASSVCSTLESTPRTVVMRRKRSSSSLVQRPISTSSRNSSHSFYNLDTDYEHNLDRRQNVYRESLDSRTLELLNQRSRNSYTQDQPLLFDALNLECGSASRRCAVCAQPVTRANSLRRGPQDTVDSGGKAHKQVSC
ncbi:hypothetical protein KR093_008756 [Drosophila rubida]|uniref:Uncharacterized protein n=1 Tax=Drosophila rubida TaxID=30044 RepID=A0AAD4K1W2_9MUSC|nr:hypothetical protein KR093_008756 [Drosophila rubida]